MHTQLDGQTDLIVTSLVLWHLVKSDVMGSPLNSDSPNFQGAAMRALQEASETYLVVLSEKNFLKRRPSVETIEEMFKGVAM